MSMTLEEVNLILDEYITIFGKTCDCKIFFDKLYSELCKNPRFILNHSSIVSQDLISTANYWLHTIETTHQYAQCVETYLNGNMYVDQEQPNKYDEIQAENAGKIVKLTKEICDSSFE